MNEKAYEDAKIKEKEVYIYDLWVRSIENIHQMIHCDYTPSEVLDVLISPLSEYQSQRAVNFTEDLKKKWKARLDHCSMDDSIKNLETICDEIYHWMEKEMEDPWLGLDDGSFHSDGTAFSIFLS